MNSSKVAVRGATLLVVVPSRGWSGFTSAADLLAVRESMNVCLTSGLTILMDASTTFCGHIPITPFLVRLPTIGLVARDNFRFGRQPGAIASYKSNFPGAIRLR